MQDNSKLQTFGIALLVSSNSLAAVLSFGGAYYAVMLLCIIIVAFSHKITFQKGLISIVLLVSYCMISGLLSNSTNTPVAYHYGLFCLVFGMVLYTGVININISQFFKHMVLIGLLCSPILLLKARVLASLIFTAESNAGNMMGMTYAIVPSVLAALSLLFLKNGVFWKVLSSLLIIVSSIILFIIGSRGAFVVFLVYFLIFCCTIVIKKTYKKVLFLLGFSIAATVVVINFDDYLLGIDNALDNKGVSVYAISKAVDRMGAESFSSGRTDIWIMAWDGFIDNPFVHPVGSFEDKHEVHEHNFMLQLMWEFGILGLIMALSITWRSIVCLFVNGNGKELQLFLTTIFCSSLIILLYSGTFWMLPCFWIWLRVLGKKIHYTYE